MFEVLAFVYQNYDACHVWPEHTQLEHRLCALGYESDEIEDALSWLQALDGAARTAAPDVVQFEPSPGSCRVFPRHEQRHLGAQAIGFLWFMENAGMLPARLREIIIERAMAVPVGPIALDDFKLIVLLVCLRFGQRPEGLILDQLCPDTALRQTH